MGDENRKLSLGWYKAEIVGKICAGVVIPLAVTAISYFYSDYLKEKERIYAATAREKEIQTRYIEVATQILQHKSEDTNEGIRLWAIEIFKKYSPIPISEKVEKELRQQPLYKSAFAEFSVGPGFKTEATVTPGNKNPQNKNLPEQQKR
jgi:hypothetical protein